MKNSIREFSKTSASEATGADAFSSPVPVSKPGPNDKIRVGFIGIGNRGSQLLGFFMKQPDCEVAALCDIYEPYLLRDRSKVDKIYLEDRPERIPEMGEKFPKKPVLYNDYRKLLEDKSIDAVCIGTPDHWHAIQTIEAIKAGKDVYCEKPLTATISEGRAMVNAQKNSDRVVAVGLNRRASLVYQKLAKEVPAGLIGKITVAQASRISNMYPDGIGKLQPAEPPKDFNWDMWLGPRAFRPYQYNIHPYNFRWWSDYSTQMGNWGVHYMDAIRWMMGEKAPVAITAHGGKFVIDDDRTIPDTMQVTYEFASGAIATFCIYEASSGGLFKNGEIQLRGTKGTLTVNEDGFRIAGARPGQFQKWENTPEDVEFDLEKSGLVPGGKVEDSGIGLVRNFLDCVKSRKEPFCTLEDGHRSTSFAHLANIALVMKQKLLWDPEKERFTNSEEANQLLSYEYRKPWSL